jgi:hypothetical protein
MNGSRALFMSLVLVVSGCCSTGASRQAVPVGADSTVTHRSPEHPTVSRVNGITLTAIVRSVSLIDSVQYTLRVTIISAVSQDGEGLTSGQEIELLPSYKESAVTAVDLTIERNKRLHALRHAAPGTRIAGTIVQDAHARWVLIDCE